MTHIDPSAEMLIREFEADKLYGEVVVKFEAGRVVLLKRSETIKPTIERSDRNTRGEDT